MNIYFDEYKKASEYGLIITNIDKGLILFHAYHYTEIGQCACICIEDEKGYIVNRLFYDQYLYSIQPYQVRG